MKSVLGAAAIACLSLVAGCGLFWDDPYVAVTVTPLNFGFTTLALTLTRYGFPASISEALEKVSVSVPVVLLKSEAVSFLAVMPSSVIFALLIAKGTAKVL